MLAAMEVATPSDLELLAAVARGEQAALGSLFDRYAPLALGLAMRVVGECGTAEQVVQDAFVSAWRWAGSYQPARAEPSNWLLAITRQHALERVRGAAGRTRGLAAVAAPLAGTFE